MIRKILVLTLFFYILVLLQTSFLVHFNIGGLVPNFILISVILINLFEKSKNYFGLFAALIGGVFLDIFSGGFCGLQILILTGLSLFIKKVLKRYV